MKRRIKYSLFLCAVLLLSSCSENTTSTIPDHPVRLQLDLRGEYNMLLGSFGASLVFDKRIKETDRIGFGGVLVCTNYEGKYLAFDLACPYEAKQNVRVKVDGFYAVCDECGSQFDIYTSEFAFPDKGPSKQGLKKYKTALSPNGILQVYR